MIPYLMVSTAKQKISNTAASDLVFILISVA
jgi:hypothetical protein